VDALLFLSFILSDKPLTKYYDRNSMNIRTKQKYIFFLI